MEKQGIAIDFFRYGMRQFSSIYNEFVMVMRCFSAFDALVRQEPIFWGCALSGSLLFVMQFSCMILGGDSSDVMDDGGSIDVGKVKWLSKQAVTGFLMIFGWVGLSCKKELHLSTALSVLISLVAGFLAVLFLGLLFTALKKLRSRGSVFNIEEAVGREAVVYQQIAKHGVGKVSLSLHDITYEIDAVAQDEEIPSFTQVRVIKKWDENTVVVVSIK